MKKNHKGAYALYIKRLLDLILALLAFIILFPVLLILTVVGAVAMKGNPFFVQARPGKDEKLFKMVKFRTMNNKRDKDGNLLPSRERLTRYGRFLRKTSMDELPELLNIIKGDLAIVGPRPLLEKYLPLYNERQHRRHEVRPGLTGLAQVGGRNALDWNEKFDLDVEYVDNISFRGDLAIIGKTILMVLKQEGIEHGNSVIMEEFKGTA